MFLVTFLCNYGLFNVVFWGSSLVSFLMDYFDVFRIRKEPRSKKLVKYGKYLGVVIFNSSLAIIPPLALLSAYEIANQGELEYSGLLRDILAGRVMTDITFYMMHRLLHFHPLYNLFHKLHHYVIEPVGITAIYMTVTDLYFGNIFPLFAPLILLKAHPFTMKVWMGLTTATAVMVGHGGMSGLSQSHDDHHANFNVNFGTDLFMDKLMGTDF